MSTRTKVFGALLTAVLLTTVSAGTAFADEFSNDSSPGFTVNAGTGPRFDDTNGGGVFPTVNNFANVTMNGTAQLTAATIDPFTVIDDSGALAGWNVTLLVPIFSNGTGADCTTGSTHTVAATGVSMNPPVIAAATADTSMTGVSAHGFTNFTTAKKIGVATATHGMGSYTVSPQILKLVVPVSTQAADYCTLATLAITSGP